MGEILSGKKTIKTGTIKQRVYGNNFICIESGQNIREQWEVNLKGDQVPRKILRSIVYFVMYFVVYISKYFVVYFEVYIL